MSETEIQYVMHRNTVSYIRCLVLTQQLPPSHLYGPQEGDVCMFPTNNALLSKVIVKLFCEKDHRSSTDLERPGEA